MGTACEGADRLVGEALDCGHDLLGVQSGYREKTKRMFLKETGNNSHMEKREQYICGWSLDYRSTDTDIQKVLNMDETCLQSTVK